MTSRTFNIFDEIEQSTTTNESTNIFDEIEAEPTPSELESVKEFTKEFGVGAFREAIRSPKTLADFIKEGSTYLAQEGIKQKIGKGEKVDPGDVQFTENVLSVLGFPSTALDYINYPSEESVETAIRGFGGALGLDLQKPEVPTLAQERGAGIGGFVGSAVLGGPRNLIKRLFLGGAAGGASQAAKEAGLGEAGQFASSFAFPVLLDVSAQIASKKFTPNTKELKQLFDFGKTVGLTEAELVPLLQPEKKLRGLSKLAKPTEKTSKTFTNIEEKLGSGFQSIKQEAKELPAATQSQVSNLVSGFESTVERLKLSDFPSTEKVQVIKKIEDAVEKITERGLTADSIIESYQDINKTVDWNKVSGGKKQLAELQKSYKEILKDVDPKVADDFNKLNKLYSNFKNVEKKIGPDQYKKFIDYGEYALVLGGLSKAAVTLDASTMAATLGTYFGAELGRNIATKMLTDPKYQNLLIKSATAVKNSSRALGLKTFKELSDLISEDFPDQAKDIDFTKFSNDRILSTRSNK